MEFSEFIKLIGKKKGTVISALVLFVALGAILTFVQTSKYSAEASLLIVQNTAPGVDPYQVSKANEYVAKVLSKVVNSGSFYNETLNAGFNIFPEYFTNDPEKQRKIWKKTVKAGVASDAGIIDIAVYHPDPDQADQIMRAIITSLKTNHQQYHGVGEAISVNVIDQPFISLRPVKPSIPANLLLAALFGLVFSLTYIYLFPEDRYRLTLWPGGKKGKHYEEAGSDSDDIYREINDARSRLRQVQAQAYHPSPAAPRPAETPERIVDQRDNRPGGYNFYYDRLNNGGTQNQPPATPSANFRDNNEMLDYDDVVNKGSMSNVLDHRTR